LRRCSRALNDIDTIYFHANKNEESDVVDEAEADEVWVRLGAIKTD
jgi:predicted neutral ceramidase superfamily lipid hydrolase